MKSKSNEAVASAIAQHLQSAANLLAESRQSRPHDAEEFTERLELLLTKIELLEAAIGTMNEKLAQASKDPPLPTAIDLWDTKHIGRYLKRSTDNVRKEIV